MEDGLFEVEASSSFSGMSGQDFDEVLLNYCSDEFKAKTGIEIRSDANATIRLKT